ncbi:VOC family protein [Montanilutibacter psychrotolerans]|uniref:VOC family protein n=1 Tax=Montanilutibacter psychrotolerans TaxID=1327343 RepID=A0A3M8STT7_9GAMM|nr:VOC family protein [Lysobacter psychrotolerans]RNF84203.1 VOC family protein [Lysobacter psychrotolerans]
MSDSKPRVHGLGGVFFKADDPAALSQWYADHLGIPMEGWGGAVLPWNRVDTGERACTVWSPFSADTRYFEPSTKPFMLNFRVDDLDATLAALRAEGCNVLDRGEDSEQGRFGYVVDPEGHLIELWQPRSEASAFSSSSTEA